MEAARSWARSDIEPVQQLTGRSQVSSIEALCEPGVHGFEVGTTLVGFALRQAKSREARRRAKLPRQRSLVSRPIERLLQKLLGIRFRFCRTPAEQHFRLHAEQLGHAPSLFPARAFGQRPVQDVDALLKVARGSKGSSEFNEHFDLVDIWPRVRRPVQSPDKKIPAFMGLALADEQRTAETSDLGVPEVDGVSSRSAGQHIGKTLRCLDVTD